MSSLLASLEQHLSPGQTKALLLEKPIQELVDLYRISLATEPLDIFVAEQNRGNPCTRDRSRELLERSLAHNLWAIRSVSQLAFRFWIFFSGKITYAWATVPSWPRN